MEFRGDYRIDGQRNQMSKVSIALCTYNGTAFLPEQLQSFVDQERLPDELIVCDDASTDDTPALIERFAADAPFPVHLHVNDSNLGSMRNFEKAIGLCSGDLIFPSDQDDVWNSSKLRVIESEFQKSYRVGLVFSDAELMDERSRVLGERLWSYTFPQKEQARATRSEFYRALWSRNVVTGATAAFRREFVPIILPVPEQFRHLIHDGWIALVVSVLADVVFLRDPLIRYRLHPGQQLGVSAPDKPTTSVADEFDWTIENLENQKTLLELLADRTRAGKTIATDFAKIQSELDDYILHLRKRTELLRSGPGRIPMILKEVASGRYRKFSRAVMSPLKDLVTH